MVRNFDGLSSSFYCQHCDKSPDWVSQCLRPDRVLEYQVLCHGEEVKVEFTYVERIRGLSQDEIRRRT